MPEAEKAPDQIPWAERTKVIHESDLSIQLERVWQDARGSKNITTADLWHKDFEWSVSIDSRAEIKNHMTLDERLTKDLLEFWDTDQEKHYSSTYRERILRWMKGGVHHGPRVKIGPKEWRPERKGPRIRAELTDSYGYGNTYNEDNAYFWGDVFEFANFKILEGDDEGEEGVVVLWSPGGSPMGGYTEPEVYLGDFEEFMDLQYEHDPWSVETFQRWNDTFENGFMWAWHKMGVFEDPEEIEDLSDRHVQQVLKAIEKDPSILLPESVEQILQKFDEFPIQIQKAVKWLMRNHKRDLEKALGQQLLWKEGELYGD